MFWIYVFDQNITLQRYNVIGFFVILSHVSTQMTRTIMWVSPSPHSSSNCLLVFMYIFGVILVLTRGSLFLSSDSQALQGTFMLYHFIIHYQVLTRHSNSILYRVIFLVTLCQVFLSNSFPIIMVITYTVAPMSFTRFIKVFFYWSKFAFEHVFGQAWQI